MRLNLNSKRNFRGIPNFSCFSKQRTYVRASKMVYCSWTNKSQIFYIFQSSKLAGQTLPRVPFFVWNIWVNGSNFYLLNNWYHSIIILYKTRYTQFELRITACILFKLSLENGSSFDRITTWGTSFVRQLVLYWACSKHVFWI